MSDLEERVRDLELVVGGSMFLVSVSARHRIHKRVMKWLEAEAMSLGNCASVCADIAKAAAEDKLR